MYREITLPDLIVQTMADVPLEMVSTFIDAYNRDHPGAKLLDPHFYLGHPSYDGGTRVLCASGSQQPELLLGFAPMYWVPTREPQGHHTMWTAILAGSHAAADEIRKHLLAQVIHRTWSLAAQLPAHPVRIASDLRSSQRADIDFLLTAGFVEYERFDRMAAPTAAPRTPGTLPDGITIRPWRMPSESDQKRYLLAYNLCLPDVPQTIDGLRFFLSSPGWRTGTLIAAFHADGSLVGSVLVHRDGQPRFVRGV